MNNETKSIQKKEVDFLKSNKFDKTGARLAKEKREKIQITKIRMTEEIILIWYQKIKIKIKKPTIREYYKNLYAKKLDQLGEMDTFLERYNLLKLTQKEWENLNRHIANKENELATKTLFTK